MHIRVLSNYESFGDGAAVWFISDDEASQIRQKMDWYLNFQLMKAKYFVPFEHSQELRAILSVNELPEFATSQNKDAPLLAPAQNYFPTEVIVQVNRTDQPGDWIAKTHRIWTALNHPNPRFFLPRSISEADFRAHWPKEGQDWPISLVIESSETVSHV